MSSSSHVSALFPVNQDPETADRNTREFLHRVIDILLEYIKKSNDRSNKILDFHHPEQMREVIDLEIPDKPLNLDQLLVDCKDTMKYGVKTGKLQITDFPSFVSKETKRRKEKKYGFLKRFPPSKSEQKRLFLT